MMRSDSPWCIDHVLNRQTSPCSASHSTVSLMASDIGIVCCADAVVQITLQVYVVGGLQTNMTTYAPFIETYDSLLDQSICCCLQPVSCQAAGFNITC